MHRTDLNEDIYKPINLSDYIYIKTFIINITVDILKEYKKESHINKYEYLFLYIISNADKSISFNIRDIIAQFITFYNKYLF